MLVARAAMLLLLLGLLGAAGRHLGGLEGAGIFLGLSGL